MEQFIEKVLISEQEIKQTVERLASQIDNDYKGEKIVLVGLLKGSVVFMSDLMRALKTPCAIDFMVASSYGCGTKSSGTVNITKDLAQPITDCNVIVVEDIIDSGTTLSYVLNYLKLKNPKSLKLCTMLDKPDGRITQVHVDYIGQTVPNEFVVGYGLDYSELYRNLPYVGILKPEIYS